MSKQFPYPDYICQFDPPPYDEAKKTAVAMIQQQLRNWGYTNVNGRSLLTDGKYGRDTETAVVAFQNARRLYPDGRVGTDTWNALWPEPAPAMPTPNIPIVGMVTIIAGHILQADAAASFNRMADAALANGINLRASLSSTYRSYALQDRLWKAALKKYINPRIAQKWVARPGTSNHNKGLAIDWANHGASDWVAKHGAAFGWRNYWDAVGRVGYWKHRFDKEWWHFDFIKYK